jgi:cobalt-zinc-cadmium resistance protein CzcA
LFEKGIKGRRKTALPVSVLLALLFGFSMNLKAQNPTLTLPEALEMAYKNNQLLQANAFEIQSQQTLRRAAGIFPKTDFNAQLGQNNSRRFDENFSVSQEIPNPALLRARRNLADQRTSSLPIGKLAISANKNWFSTSAKVGIRPNI